MRKLLASDNESRKKFKAIFSRVGKKTNYKGYAEDTLLLTDIIDIESGTLVTDHVWFTFTKGFEQANLQAGCQVEFEARIKSYKKGYVNKRYKIDNSRTDYKLSHPTKIKVVKT